jgi:hypothetical protein
VIPTHSPAPSCVCDGSPIAISGERPTRKKETSRSLQAPAAIAGIATGTRSRSEVRLMKRHASSEENTKSTKYDIRISACYYGSKHCSTIWKETPKTHAPFKLSCGLPCRKRCEPVHRVPPSTTFMSAMTLFLFEKLRYSGEILGRIL